MHYASMCHITPYPTIPRIHRVVFLFSLIPSSISASFFSSHPFPFQFSHHTTLFRRITSHPSKTIYPSRYIHPSTQPPPSVDQIDI
ncbi:hypothetical protein DM02DRAFT_90635 [Periconia macrospinosa]|uniref:Uncharacterized protein n=1 Tax=Periconia macrospinosa TaxID=97972 RepID=A0A2V1DGB9_9PLEO|nr:hypothetical protein DM02DRAFT_90635 [Periconia macrospinosa]